MAGPGTTRAHARDALLALLALAALVALLARQGALDALADPATALVGIGGAVLIEAAFLRVPALGHLWERPVAYLGGLVALLASAAAAYALVGPALVAAACWGLVVILALLAAVVVTGRNPLAVVLDG